MPAKWQIPRDLPWSTPYPLPRDTAQAVLEQEKDGTLANAGLLLDRFLPYARARQGPEIVREFTNRVALVPDFTRLADLVAANAARWDVLAQSQGAATFTARPEWRTVVGLGTHALLEGGLLLHRISGLPLIPASVLKGVTRLYAEQVEEISSAALAELFGESDDEARQGSLLFLDALPAAVPVLERDVMNAHLAMYYGSQENVAPADYLSPRPVFLLAIGKASPFRFGVASVDKDEAAATCGATWLRLALREVGIGAKTAAGYGYWVETAEGLP